MGSISDFILRLTLDGKGVAVGGAQVQSSFAKLAKTAAGFAAGYLSVGFLKGRAEEAIEFASKISDLSRETGVSTTKLQEWAYAAKLAGSNLEDVAAFFVHLAKARREALQDPSGKWSLAFKVFGISESVLRSRRLEDIGSKIAKAFEAGDPQKLIAPLRELGGRGVGGLISAFSQGMEAAASEAQRLKLIIGQDLVERLNKMGEALDRNKLKWNAWISLGVGWAATKFEEFTYGLRVYLAGYQAESDAWNKGIDRQGQELARKQAQNREVISILEDEIVSDTAKKSAAAARAAALLGGDSTTELLHTASISSAKLDVDKLAKIGLYRGGDPVLNVQKQTLNYVRDIASFLREFKARGDFEQVDIGGEMS